VGIAGANTASFVYDAFGRRVSKNINGSVTQFVYDHLNPVEELDGASPANVTANLLTGLNIDEYFTRADSNGAMNFLTDALGSTLALADSSGAINTSYTYEPFGNTSIGGSNPNPYQFTGRENDGTGLYFYRARYYNPTFQRFASQDPIGLIRGNENLYRYVLNDPIAFGDSLGLVTPTPLWPTPTSTPTPVQTPTPCPTPDCTLNQLCKQLGSKIFCPDYCGGEDNPLDPLCESFCEEMSKKYCDVWRPCTTPR